MKPELLEDIYLNALQQTLEGERVALQLMAKLGPEAAPELAQLFERHTRETQEQITRLERCLKRFESRAARAPKAQVVAAAFAELQEQLAPGLDRELATVLIGAAARKVEHIEIGCYADLITTARALRFDEDARLLNETLQEERRMENALAGIAENTASEAAALNAATA